MKPNFLNMTSTGWSRRPRRLHSSLRSWTQISRTTNPILSRYDLKFCTGYCYKFLFSIQESIRRGHDDLGDHYLNCGDLQNALKAYSRSVQFVFLISSGHNSFYRARDYCTSGKHVVNMCLNVIKVSVYLQNWSHVISYVNKAMATPDYADGNG